MSNLGGNSPSEDTDRSNNLQGDTGATGATGAQGDQGDTGEQGEQGETGAAGSGSVATVVGGTNCSVDSGDAANPIVNADTQVTNTTKGDIEGYSTVAERIPVGANDTVLTADSTADLGVAWKTPAGGGTSFKGALVEEETSFSRGSSGTDVNFDTEVYDTDSFATLGTNSDRLTVPANVSKVTVIAYLNGLNVASGKILIVKIEHYNSSDALIRDYQASSYSSFSTVKVHSSTPVIPVSSGDYFKMEVSSSDTSWNQIYAALGLEYKDGSL